MSAANGGVRRAAPGDEPGVRALRLRALAAAPEAFGSTLDRERARTDAEWARWIEEGATFLFERDGVPLGIAAGVRHDGDPASRFLMAMWVDEAARGTGAADALVEAVIAWAEAEDARALVLHVGEPNTRARRLYERHGFRATGAGFVRDRDGMFEVEMRRDLERVAERPR